VIEDELAFAGQLGPSPTRPRMPFLAQRLRSLAGFLGLAGFMAEALDVARASAALEGHRTTVVFDRHGLLGRHRPVREAVVGWLEDPAPRMPGLRLRVRPRDDRPYFGICGPDVELTLTSETPAWCLHSRCLLCGHMLDDLSRPGRREGDLRRMIDHQLEQAHRGLVELLRDRREIWPKRRTRVVSAFGATDPAIWRGYW
jgi:hypothetical protein